MRDLKKNMAMLTRRTLKYFIANTANSHAILRWENSNSNSTFKVATINYYCLSRKFQITSLNPMLKRPVGLTQVKYLSTETELIHECWKCGTKLDAASDQYFCECGVVQPPKICRNYFSVMDMDVQFDIDLATLKRTFTNLQRSLHPDKFTQKSETEKEFSLQQSSTVNKAYTTLLKPLSRGLYMLELYGKSVDESDIQADPKFLMEIMETNEELAEADSLEAVEEIGAANQSVLDDLTKQLSDAFKSGDISQAKDLLARLKYYANIDEKVKDLQRLYAEKI